MPKDEERTNISRRQLIKRGAVVGGAAIWVPPVIQSLRMPAHAQVGSPPPVECIVDGWMTGGGWIDTTNVGRVTYDLRKLDCPPIESPPELKISWSTGSGKNKVNYDFELLSYTSRVCIDDPGIPNGPSANFDTIVGTGTGTLTIDGVSQDAGVQFGFVDGGEGNPSGDRVTLIVSDAANTVLVNIVDDAVDAGNLQAHHGNDAFGDACPH